MPNSSTDTPTLANKEHKHRIPQINWYKAHLIGLYSLSTSSLAYALLKTHALSKLHGSLLLATGQNFTLLSLCGFFTLFTCLMATREPDKATFATTGAILTAMVI